MEPAALLLCSIFQDSQSSRHQVHRLGIWKMKLWVPRKMMDPVDPNTTRLAPLLTQPLLLVSKREELLKCRPSRPVEI